MILNCAHMVCVCACVHFVYVCMHACMQSLVQSYNNNIIIIMELEVFLRHNYPE